MTKDAKNGKTDGRVGRIYARSEPSWPPTPSPGPRAPNVIVMLLDDMGYSDVGCFGSEIPTPNIDRLAERGLKYTNFHVAPKCSPTRASMMTGMNHHSVGYSDVVHYDSGFPHSRYEMPTDVPTLPEYFRRCGYSTFMVGKWHLAKELYTSAASPRRSWPLQCGFDQFYGFLDGFTNLHEPHELIEGNSILSIDSFPPGYYLTDDLNDRAIRMIKETKAANPAKPFLLYFSHAAVHAPLHAKAEDIERHHGRYDAGWDEARAERLRRQMDLGIVAPDVTCSEAEETGYEIPHWNTLSEDQRRLYARYMETYAAMITSVDDNVGRMCETLRRMGELDNTIFVFLSDNGASGEGGPSGSPCYLGAVSFLYTKLDGEPVGAKKLAALTPDRIDLSEIGGIHTMPHYPRGWARVSNTPFRLFKKFTHAGGHQVPFIISWPDGIRDHGGIRRQYAHVSDLLPTLLDLARGSGAPEVTLHDRVVGKSFAGSISDTDAPETRLQQHYELEGNRGIYRDGWEAVARHQRGPHYDADRWELYNLRDDPTETHDLAGSEPARLQALTDAWEELAEEYGVFPLDDGSGLKRIWHSPEQDALDKPVTIYAGTPTLSRFRSRLLIQLRSYTVTAQLEGYRSGDQGVLVAHGDQGGGYMMFVENGRLCYAHTFANQTRYLDGGAVPVGASTITLDVAATAGGASTVSLSMDGASTASGHDFELFWGMSPFQGIDVGIDRRSPVSREVRDRHGCFPFTGQLHSVTYAPGTLAPDSPFRKSPEELRAALLELMGPFE
ncbi:sulfatase-like hydrolase/transferase [Oricola sp.]|uniref:sulfatase-like hydrolase/transferase n=1 Tax=Oricola sp. TaxID=1979950 RepID=UPI0035172A41